MTVTPLTKRDGSPAPTHLKVSREWTYDVVKAGLALSESTDGPIHYEDVLDLIHDWIHEDFQQPVVDLPAIQEVYVTNGTSQEPGDCS